MVGASLHLVGEHCAECAIRGRAVCAGCDGLALERIRTFRRYRPGDPIVWAGEPATTVATVLEGVASMTATLPDGRRQMVGLLLPSDFLGRPGRPFNAYDVTAATDVTLCVFRRAEFEALIARTPDLGRRLLEMTLDELDAAREWLLILGRKSARERIASLLVILARRDAALRGTPPAADARFPLHVSREMMADCLGLTIETVSRQISGLRRDGLVELAANRMARAPSLARLIAASGEDPGPAGASRDPRSHRPVA